MKRATLIKLRNGRHRVATPSEVAAAAAAAREQRFLGDYIKRLADENSKLRKTFAINNEIADRLAAEFGQHVKPILDQWLRATQRPRRELAFLDVTVDIARMQPVRRHTAVIPEIVFCYDEEIRP